MSGRKSPMLIWLTDWYKDNIGLFENDSFQITLEFIRKNGGLLKQVTDRFYSNGEFIPKAGIAVKIRDMLGRIRNPSMQKKGNAKSNTEQRARKARVEKGTASTVDIKRENACFVSSDRFNAARSHTIELRKKPGAIDLLPDDVREDVQARLKGYDKNLKDNYVIAKRKRDEFVREEFDARTHRENTRTVHGEFAQPVNEDGGVMVDMLLCYLVGSEFTHTDYDELRDEAAVALLCHCSSVSPAWFQVLDDGGDHEGKKALMPAANLKEATIQGYTVAGYGSFNGIAHLKALKERDSFTLSKFVYAHPSFFGALEFFFRHWRDFYKMTPGAVVYVYIITNCNCVFPLFYQTRIADGAVGPGCELLCKYQPTVDSPALPDACIQVTIGSNMKDRLGSSEFRLIRNKGDMETPIDILLED